MTNARLLPGLLTLAALVPSTALAGSDPAPATRAQVQQIGTQLRWTTAFRARPDLAGGVCLRLRYGTLTTPRAQVCVEGSPPELRYERLDRNGGVVASERLPGTIDARARTLRVTFPLAPAKLTARRYSWQVATSGADALPAVAARTVTPPTPRPTGCTPHGAAQVTAAPGSPKTVALTFDDGPGPYTSEILAILEREHVPATFFVIGRQVAGNEPLLRRMLAGGSSIGNHTWDHADISGGELDEVTRTQAAVRAATGYTPCLVRPPYGATSASLVGELRANRLTSVLWNVDPADWSTPGTDAIVSRVLAQAKAGSIILMHDGGGNRSQTVAALPAVIRALAARGYAFATVPQLLHYEIETAKASALPATSWPPRARAATASPTEARTGQRAPTWHVGTRVTGAQELELAPVVDAELEHRAVDVRLDGADGEDQPVGDVGVR